MYLDALLGGLVIVRLRKYGHLVTLAKARKRFDAHFKGEFTIPAYLRSAVYSLSMVMVILCVIEQA